MYKFNMQANQNEIDAEIDEFGDLTSLGLENEKVKIGFRKGLSPKAVDRKKYNRTGIAQLGTTYPNSYDREELIKFTKKPTNFYKKTWVAMIATILVIVIDFCCYLFMLSKDGEDFKILLVAVGVSLAIDFLPFFIAHNLHRCEIDRKKVLRFFNRFCIIFIFIFLCIVFIYRIVNGTDMTTNESSWGTDDSSLPYILQSVFFALIPIATSLLCFIINYVSYNPIQKKINIKRREILFKREDVNELEALIVEIEAKGDYKKFLEDKDDQMYRAANDMIDSIGEYYKAYVRTEIVKQLQSPADTTDLSIIN